MVLVEQSYRTQACSIYLQVLHFRVKIGGIKSIAGIGSSRPIMARSFSALVCLRHVCFCARERSGLNRG